MVWLIVISCLLLWGSEEIIIEGKFSFFLKMIASVWGYSLRSYHEELAPAWGKVVSSWGGGWELPIKPAFSVFSGMLGTRTGNFACPPPKDLEQDIVKARDWWLIRSPPKSWKHFISSYAASDEPSQTLSMTVRRAGSIKETGTTQRRRCQDFTLVLVTHWTSAGQAMTQCC